MQRRCNSNLGDHQVAGCLKTTTLSSLSFPISSYVRALELGRTLSGFKSLLVHCPAFGEKFIK